MSQSNKLRYATDNILQQGLIQTVSVIGTRPASESAANAPIDEGRSSVWTLEKYSGMTEDSRADALDGQQAWGYDAQGWHNADDRFK